MSFETYWSDDTRVTAIDYIYAWRDRILDPNSPNPAAALFYDNENAASVKSGNGSVSDIGVYASELYQITLVYREGADYEQLLKNLASVATSPVRQDIVAASPTYWSKLVNTIVFNGPFKIKTVDNEVASFSIGRNLGYHQNPTKKDYDNKVNPAQISTTFTIGGEEVALSCSDLEDKTIFYMTDASIADREAYGDKAEMYDDTSVYTYVFNTTNELLAIPEVRQALSLAIDREQIANAIYFGKSTGTARAQYLLLAEQLLCEQLPVCPIFFNRTVAFESKEISGVTVDGFGNLVFTDMKQRNYRKHLED